MSIKDVFGVISIVFFVAMIVCAVIWAGNLWNKKGENAGCLFPIMLLGYGICMAVAVS